MCVCLCVAEWQIFSCVPIGRTTSFQSCTTRQRGSPRTLTSGRWRLAWTTARTTRFTRWTAASAISWCWRPSRHQCCQCPSLLSLVHSATRHYHQPFTSLTLVLTLWSPRTMLCRWLSRRSATGWSLPKPSTFASCSFRFRNSCSADAVTAMLCS